MFAILVVMEDKIVRSVKDSSDLEFCNWQKEGNSSLHSWAVPHCQGCPPGCGHHSDLEFDVRVHHK